MAEWNEADHPRDEEGKFTFSGGGDDSNCSFDKEKNLLTCGISKNVGVKEQTRNQLLHELGNRLSREEILYSTVDELKKIKESIKNNTSKAANYILQKGAEFGLGGMYQYGGYNYANAKYGPDTVGMVDLAHEKRLNPNYTYKAKELKNYNDTSLEIDKEYLKDKISQQFKDYGFKVDEIKGYYFEPDSDQSYRMSQDKDFKKMIQENKESLLKGQQISGNFPLYKDGKESNWHYAIGHYDVRNSYIDKRGNLRLKVYDTYDFNKENKGAFNQAGRTKMLDGTLKPYFTVHDIIIPKSELDILWGKN